MRISDDDKIFEAHITNANSDLMFFKSDNTVARTDIENFGIKKEGLLLVSVELNSMKELILLVLYPLIKMMKKEL